ncbi:hypothetical protein D3C71_1509280 [compost metagenome]
MGVKGHGAAGINDMATRGLHHIVDQRHTDGCANGGLAAHGAALGGGGGDGFLLRTHRQIAAQLGTGRAQMRGGGVAHHSHGGRRRDGHAAGRAGFRGGGGLVIGVGIKNHILAARQRGSDADIRLGAIGHHIDRCRGTNAQRVAGCRRMRRGLGGVVGGAIGRHGHITVRCVQRAAGAQLRNA